MLLINEHIVVSFWLLPDADVDMHLLSMVGHQSVLGSA